MLTASMTALKAEPKQFILLTFALTYKQFSKNPIICSSFTQTTNFLL